MKKYLIALFLLLVPIISYAHDMVPTYPVLRPSYMAGVLVTEIELFNKRNDVEYYEIAVFDKDFGPVPFVSSFKIFKLEYLKKVKVEIYIREQDKDRAVYVCSRSRAPESEKVNINTGITSMICSKFKRN